MAKFAPLWSGFPCSRSLSYCMNHDHNKICDERNIGFQNALCATNLSNNELALNFRPSTGFFAEYIRFVSPCLGTSISDTTWSP